MKLEQLNSEKFKDVSIDKDQMSVVKGGLLPPDTATPAGNTDGQQGGRDANFDYGYDSDRGDGFITYHNRSNICYY